MDVFPDSCSPEPCRVPQLGPALARRGGGPWGWGGAQGGEGEDEDAEAAGAVTGDLAHSDQDPVTPCFYAALNNGLNGI